MSTENFKFLEPGAREPEALKKKRPRSTAGGVGVANGEQGKQKKKRREEIVQVQQPPQRTTQRGPPTAAATAEADDRLPRTVFVGNLPAHVKRKSLAQLFAGCGRVESVRLRSLPLQRDPTSKIPRRGAIASGAIDADQSAHA
ncbi:hypothetical protein CHLNCDRAFT_140240 [Chlorella variabilis]|uniref:RRM domain-containing protein n=1 Tax=Chlorella variabilis TaxID=554065 RepID=E1ZRV5_CHLVA|nr:hypothetical protein CHLNCDRAFT_140240 [Chlorella variabilis]EFN51527.1 hypothetical protein CHLNCDRAFT_140240 [Chlorella variabilis]|eukprot:XP_005843629.1 hypothetical protein CHLNCDRAFT_140240 [Chlorella variabilis]